MHICFSSHYIVLFPLRTPASWMSAKCTRRLFKVWRNWPNSKLICFSEKGEPRLSFEYKFVGHPWNLLKLYPTVDSYFLFGHHAVLYCFHWEHHQSWRSAKCTRRPSKVCQFWIWPIPSYVKEPPCALRTSSTCRCSQWKQYNTVLRKTDMHVRLGIIFEIVKGGLQICIQMKA